VGHFTLRSGKELQTEYFTPPGKRAIGAIGQHRKTGTSCDIPTLRVLERSREEAGALFW